MLAFRDATFLLSELLMGPRFRSLGTPSLPRSSNVLSLRQGTNITRQEEVSLISMRLSSLHVSCSRYINLALSDHTIDNLHLDWSDEASIRAFIASESYQSYLKALGLNEKHTGATGPALSVAELIHDFFYTASIATIYTFGFAYPTAPDIPSDLRGLTPTVPFDIYDPGPLGERGTKYGWILDPQLVEGRLVKKGMTLKTWAPLESLEKQLEVYKAVSEQPSEDWRLKVEALHPLSVDETTCDFSELEEPVSESEPETGLEDKSAKTGIQE